MRVALLTFDYPPAPSGLSVAAREIAESLADAGCDVTVFTLDRTGMSHAGGVRIIGCEIDRTSTLAKLRLWCGAGHLAAPIAFRRAVLREHVRNPFDIVEATNWYAPAALLARQSFALVTRNSTPAAFSRETATSLRDRLDGLSADWLEKRQARSSTALISNTDDHGQKMQRLYGIPEAAPHASIGLSLKPEFLARAAQAGEAGDGPLRILFVGRSERRKGFDALVGAHEILSRESAEGRLPDYRLRLLGVSPQDVPSTIGRAAQDRLVPLGRRPDEELHREYAAAHIVAAPSRYESFGLVYQEALAYGRPVVASAEDASARVFVGDAGSLAERTTGEGVADALRPLIASPSLRRTLREKALLAAGRFTRESLARETLALYAKARARRQSL